MAEPSSAPATPRLVDRFSNKAFDLVVDGDPSGRFPLTRDPDTL